MGSVQKLQEPLENGFVDVPEAIAEFQTPESLSALESDEQRHVLDVVAGLRKCGLEGVLSLPQLVVCGDQSAGKSSVLEALTEIPFPRNDNLCTRFATEIILRRGTIDSLETKVIPDPKRPAVEREKISAFIETITNFDDLPNLMTRATDIMGLNTIDDPIRPRRAFAKDTLSITIEGPQRPQLTLVDLPGIIQAETKDASQEDVALVSEITDHYISQERTICLAVISATHDYANQAILRRVRNVDPKGERTLGIITKPDRLPAGSGSEEAFINLARNDDIRLGLGWHVLKNRSFEETALTFPERNAAEAAFFHKSNFNKLDPSMVGIHSLVSRISQLLFQHVQQFLPDLQHETKDALQKTKSELKQMGQSRVGVRECKAYLTQFSQGFAEVCKAGMSGNYEGSYFIEDEKDIELSVSPRRLRAAIQLMNLDFTNTLRRKGHKFQIEGLRNPKPTDHIQETIINPMETLSQEAESSLTFEDTQTRKSQESQVEGLQKPKPSGHTQESIINLLENLSQEVEVPLKLSTEKSHAWVRNRIQRSRGRELPGNFNPLVIGELFWEQSSRWQDIAVRHTERVADVCNTFLYELLQKSSPKDICTRLWPHIQDEMTLRSKEALTELCQLREDLRNHPIYYDHYYTDTALKRSKQRSRQKLKKCLKEHTTEEKMPCYTVGHAFQKIDVDGVLESYFEHVDPDMDKHGCDGVLDYVYAIYKALQKVFMANVTTQVIERHIVRDLDRILSPVSIAKYSDTEVEKLSSEPQSARKQREFLTDRAERLEKGWNFLRQVMQTPAI